MTMIELLIFQAPPSGNVLRRVYRSPYRYRQLRDEWGYMLKAAASPHERNLLRNLALGCRKTEQRTKVSICVQHKRLYDRDNLWSGIKPIPDALVSLGWLVGDSEEEIDLSVTQEQGQVEKTIIRLEVI